MILQTERLTLRKLTLADAPFIYELVNSPNWLEYIGEKNVKNLKDAENYIQAKILNHYKKHGFGFYLAITKDTKQAVGLTGFIKRDSLDNPEVGYAFLPSGSGKGYALESTKAILNYGKTQLNIAKIVAITHPDNKRSQKLLLKLGFQYISLIKLPEFEIECSYFEEVS